MKVTALTSDGVLLTCGGFVNLQCLAFDLDTNSWQPHSSLDKGEIYKRIREKKLSANETKFDIFEEQNLI